MLPPLLSSLLFLSFLHLTLADELPRWDQCDSTTNYTANSAFSSNLDRALDTLRNSTSLTNFNTTTATTSVFGNETVSVTALALCRGDITPLDCRTCIDIAVTGILQLCPNQTTAAIWYNYCMLRYSSVNFLSRPDNTISFLIWDLRVAPEPDIYDQKVQVLMLNLSISAGESEKRYALGWTNVTDTLTLYGYVECTRDLNGNDCTKCLMNARSGIEMCCLGRWAGWIGTPSCAIRFNMDRIFNDTVAAAEVSTDLPPPPPPILSPPPPPLTTIFEIPTVTQNTNGGVGRGVVIGVSIAAVGAVILVVGCFWVVKKKIKTGGSRNNEEEDGEEMMRDSVGTRCILYDLETLVAATDNFSSTNRLGSGGFGAVYKGRVANGEEIAVKKLTVGSVQGVEEFSNEVRLLLKMQHRNLVRLFGWCVQGEDKMLVYEYLPNKSLDYFLFDKSKSAMLDWPKRFNIMMGIARGLLYLHEDSQLRIIHRDVKASNILLDENMNPKISDFGLAKLFPDEQSHLRTRRIAGTIGYMAPEYAVRGVISAKSDIFSFGVLMLEIISGRKNYNLQLDEQSRELLKLTWRLEQEGRLLELVDVTIGSCPQVEVLKCIRIGLLCCQDSIQERPITSSILAMLSHDSVTVPHPGRPGYQGSRDNTLVSLTTSSNDSAIHENENVSNNAITTSLVSGR